MKHALLKSIGLMAIILAGPLAANPAQAKIQVVVSILPQQWFVEHIGGDLVDTAVLVGPGHSPATFEPTPKQLAHLQGADLFISAGVPFEKGLLPRVESMRNGPRTCGNKPDPNRDGHDHHHGIDPHTWLDPSQALQMAELICAELSQLKPESRPVFEANLEALHGNLTQLEEQIRSLLTPYRGREFFVFHPAFGHFASTFGLVQIAVEEHGHEPGPKQLASVIEHAKSVGASAIIVQPQFSRKAASTVARAAGLEVVDLDPLSPQYDTNLLHIAKTLVKLFESAKKAGP